MMAAAAAVTALPMAAYAVPVAVDASVDLGQPAYSFSTTVNPGDDGAVFTFTILEAMQISGISVSGSGTNGGDDIASTTFQVVNPDFGPSPFQSFTTSFGVGSGSAVVSGQTYAAGDQFTVTFVETAENPISYTVSFPVAEVPVPAAGLLLLGALGGFAGLRRRKKA
ncbi:hypothetical protein AB838_06895 [Rhodobacteraceae bacterium (ex Bugula neritina AB1)]|nr:hypothetical protein AB838_06895 [Rhodobacteraceae bacterium (ex Bugula neritina AB1)]